MDSLATTNIGSEYLVTDLVNELSSGLEIPFLLRDDITIKEEQVDTLYNGPINNGQDNVLFCGSLLEQCPDNSIFNYFDGKDSFYDNNDSDYDIRNQLQKSKYFDSESKTICGSSGDSDSSSTEKFVIKNEFDTPPITPPDERVSPDSILLLPADDCTFMPVNSDDQVIKNSENVKINVSNNVNIQPKPSGTSLHILDPQGFITPTVICNVFSDVNSNTIKYGEKVTENHSFDFLTSNNAKKKPVLSKNDVEVLQAKRKQERMIRNRESAYLSRKRKKEHVAQLEKQVQDLLLENNHLKLENCSLRQRLSNYEDIDILPCKKSKSVYTSSHKKFTAVLALVFTICLNLGPFSSLVTDIKQNDKALSNNIVPVYPNEVRHSRSLLWTETELKNVNSSFGNLTKTSCPVFINQTESIRLESELRRWIGVGDDDDDDNSGLYNYNISRLSQFFDSSENVPSKKNNSKQKGRKRNTKSHSKSYLEMKLYKMKPNILNFDTFFGAINRRDDTFYLVSFSGDHLLLPALSHNKTSRPKMSLMLPAFLSNFTGISSDQVELMQIDCEVTNTQLLSVNENDIPTHMRPYTNYTSKPKNSDEKKSNKFDEFFLQDQENLLPAKKIHYKSKKFSPELKSHGLPMRMNRNGGKPVVSKLAKTVDQHFNQLSPGVNNSRGKRYSQQLFDEKTVSNDFGKNLLKMLLESTSVPQNKVNESSLNNGINNDTKLLFH